MIRSRWYARFARLCGSVFLCLGCQSAPTEPLPVPGTDAATATAEPPLIGVPRLQPTASGLPSFCARQGRSDDVREIFCRADAPRIESLLDLQQALGILGTPSTPTGQEAMGRGALDYGAVVLLSHSTALSGDVVSQLNPRAIMANRRDFLAFSRGVQQVELIALDSDPEANRFNFYLLRFEQACNGAAHGCSPHDLYTARIETDWTLTTLEDDEDLKNTPDDCRQCHQRGSDRTYLLMRELQGPWTHFFGPEQEESYGVPEPSGTALLRDYLQAKGDEPYANVSSEGLRSTVGFNLQRLVHQDQPLLFDGSAILNERWPWRDGRFADQPERSATWDAGYAAFKRGEQLSLPYFAPRATDPDKLLQLTAAYQRYRAGELDPADFPDLSDVFPDDPVQRAEIGLSTDPTSSPAEVLIQACAQCHNDALDQSLSRARFSVALGRMSRAERELAIARLKLPRTAPGAMPPRGRRQVLPEQTEALIEYLQREQRPSEDDALLEHAAMRGMIGGGRSTTR